MRNISVGLIIGAMGSVANACVAFGAKAPGAGVAASSLGRLLRG